MTDDVIAGMLDLNYNYPSLPGQAELLRTALRQLALSGDLESLLRYQPHGGRLHERASVARQRAHEYVISPLTDPETKMPSTTRSSSPPGGTPNRARTGCTHGP